MPTHLMLPWAPSVNHYWKPIAKYNARTRKWYGELVLTSQAKKYQERAGWEILAQRPRQHAWPYETPVMVTLTLTPPALKRTRDTDNNLKATWDVLVKAGVLRDDSLIQEVHIYPHAPAGQGHMDIQIAPYHRLLP